jgi:hypothetical protein
MKKLAGPIPFNSRGQHVADLHALILLAGLPLNEEEINSQWYGEATREAVRKFQLRFPEELEPTGELDLPTLRKINAIIGGDEPPAGPKPEEGYTVSGHCYTAVEEPLKEVIVKAYSKLLRTEVLLGGTKTDEKGHYLVRYFPHQQEKKETTSLDIFIRIFDGQGTSLAQSPVSFQAPPALTIDLKVGGGPIKGPSEYQQLIQTLQPHMQQLHYTDLREDKEYQDISYLSKDTGQDKTHIMELVLASLAEEKTSIATPYFYGLFREKIPISVNTYINTYLQAADDTLPIDQLLSRTLDDLFSTNADSIQNALERAISDNIIPLGFGGDDKIDRVMDKIRSLQTTASLNKPLSGKTPIGSLLNISVTDQNLQQQFISLFNANTAKMTTFWSNLGAQPGFTPAIAQDIRQTLLLGSRTLSHVPLVQKLKGLFTSGQLKYQSDLARWSVQNWVDLLNQQQEGNPIGVPPNIDGKDENEKINLYATILEKKFAVAYPTTAFSARLASDPKAPALLTQRQALTTFLDAQPKFRLGHTNVDQYLMTNKISNTSPEMVSQLKMVHRIFKLTSSYTTATALLSSNIHSSQQIYSMGRSNFMKQFGTSNALGTIMANRIYGRAEYVYANALTLHSQYNYAYNNQPVASIPDLNPAPATAAAIATIPDLQSLFGSMSYCECQECRSVYSAAAYLVDMLQFLKARSPLNGKTPKDVLFERRPDLGQILLSCENTNTALPYIDLVCEILEDVISPPAMPVARQTTLTTDELRANPEYINLDTYLRLQNNEVFPFLLPFCFWLENNRTYIANMGVSWYQFKQTAGTLIAFPPPPAPTPTAKYLIYDEYLLISEQERQVICANAPLLLSWQYWGLAQNGNNIPNPSDPTTTLSGDWMTLLSQVPVFLNRSGLSYRELLTLLGLRFINPDGSIAIKDNENTRLTSCDTAKFTIAPITQDAFDRIHRFLRLWKKIGCTLWELDEMIMDPISGGGLLNDDTLLHISFLKQLVDQFGLNWDQALALSSPIGTYDYVDYTTDDEPVVYSLYAQLFRNLSVLDQADIDAHFPKDASTLSGKLSDAIVPISSACTISVSDMGLIFDYLGIDPTTALPPAVAPNIPLYLTDLSILYRYSQMASLLGLTIEQLIDALKIISSFDAFAGPENNGLFIRKVQKIQSSAFSIDQLNYILFNYFKVSSGVAPDPVEIASFLTDLQAGLQQIYTATAIPAQPVPKDLQDQLAKLKIANNTILQVLSSLNSSAVYSFVLTAPNPAIVFPPSIRIAFDPGTSTLSFTGQMRTDELQALLLLPGVIASAEYQTAINQFYTTPRNILSAALAYYVTPVFTAPLAALPADVSFLSLPAALRQLIQYDSNRQILQFTGIMTADQETQLKNLDASNDPLYLAAITTLQNAPSIPSNIDPDDIFLIGTDIIALFDIVAPATAPIPDTARLTYILQKLCTYLRNTSAENLVKQKYVAELQISASVADQLITQFQASPSLASYRIIQDYNQDGFVSDPNVITPVSYPAQFRSYTQLYKISVIVNGLGVTDEEWPWWMLNSSSVKSFAFNALPMTVADPPIPFAQFEVLLDAYTFKNSFPKSSVSFLQFLQDPSGSIATFTYWNTSDLTQLTTALTPDYTDFSLLLRMADCFRMMKTLGIGATSLLAWSADGLTTAQMEDNATEVKQAAKAKYNNTQWLSVAKKLQDGIREKKRDALINFLLYHPELVHQQWTMVDDQLGYFLIDTQMGACQMTSRIVQANSSIQLFVQRCLMNLEPEVQVDTAQEPEWLQWKWMQYYRVWEANREVFLYPENYIEYPLRDNKTPFYTDFENQLRQNEITSSSAEDAFMAYLEKLDDVARLKVCGTYHHQEDNDTNLLYVFASTTSVPPIYYYRTRDLNTLVWSAWQKIDLDISTEQLIPLIWNRRLYLFWTVFTEKPNIQQPTPPAQASSSTPPQPLKHWEVQLSWSEFKNNKWLAKKTSKEVLVISDSPQNPISNFLLKTAVLPTGDLEIDFYAVTLIQFNFTYQSGGTYSEENSVVVHGPTRFFEFLLSDARAPIQAFSTELDTSGFLGSLPKSQNISDYWSDMLPISLNMSSQITLPDTMINQDMFLVSNVAGAASSNDSRQQTYKVYFLSQSQTSLSSEQVLQQADKFSVVIPHQLVQFDSSIPFFFQDTTHAYYVNPVKYYKNGNYWTTVAPSSLSTTATKTDYQFQIFYHPYANLFIRQLNRFGIDKLLDRQLQVAPDSLYNTTPLDFKKYYLPTGFVDKPYPVEDVDFTNEGAYSIYNWELFFFQCAYIASQLSTNQRFSEAMQWYNYIFNPTGSAKNIPATLPQPAAPQGIYWITKPFYLTTSAEYLAERIDQVMAAIAAKDPDTVSAVQQWRNDPFNPHLIARLRPVAYQKNIVMNYIDNLIAWGDSEFRMNTLESINIATQLYVLAAQILGPRPEDVPPVDTPDKSYNDLEPALDAFSNAIVEVENLVAPGGPISSSDSSAPPLPTLYTFYFCIPPNDQLAGYWDTVADRLFKIRHCMNIEGVVQQLPLFQPPINPALLVAAAAAGVDLSSVLADLDAPLPYYRFSTMSQKATELCQELMNLGTAFLSALEKKDAEGLALLRSSLELKLLSQMRDVRQREIDAATQFMQGVQASQAVVQARLDFYTNVQKISSGEQQHMDLLNTSNIFNAIAQGINIAGSIAHLIPKIKLGFAGFGGSPAVDAAFGGSNLGSALMAAAGAANFVATIYSDNANMASINAVYQRRWDDWQLQKSLAQLELNQLAYQLSVANIRIDIATKELADHDTQTDNSQQIDDYMHNKYTNQDLYDWMVSQLSGVYFQSYQLAYDMAKKAERTFRHELGLDDSGYIQFGYWDSLKKGLLSGEQLLLDIKRMEAAYLDQNQREYELTKHISMALLDPVALLKLKENGECFLDIPEIVFDMDFPGHDMRLIKCVSITSPCVAGPYTTVGCTLTLIKNSIRISSLATAPYPRVATAAHPDDDRFRDNIGSIQSIATSSAQNDNGLFEMNFRDERYLPFEGQGAISSWHLTLNNAFRQFDYDTISDVIIHLNYTSREGGDALKDLVVTTTTAPKYSLLAQLNSMPLSESKAGLYRLFSARHDFPNSWYSFLNPPNPGTDDQQLLFTLPGNRFPYFSQGKKIMVRSVELVVEGLVGKSYEVTLPPLIGSTTPAVNAIALNADGVYNGFYHLFQAAPAPIAISNYTLQIRQQGNDFKSIAPDELSDIFLIINYTIS